MINLILDRIGSSASEAAMWPYTAVPPQESGQADFSLPVITVGLQVHLLVFDHAPQTLHQDVVAAALPSQPTDPDPLSLQAGHKVGGGELAPLIRVEDLGLTATTASIERDHVLGYSRLGGVTRFVASQAPLDWSATPLRIPFVLLLEYVEPLHRDTYLVIWSVFNVQHLGKQASPILLPPHSWCRAPVHHDWQE